MYATAVLGVVILSVSLMSVCLSVRPSVTRLLSDKTMHKQCSADILIPHERAITLYS